ncbi:hypothetical protein SCANM63S_08015 [Streptomyces canarius]
MLTTGPSSSRASSHRPGGVPPPARRPASRASSSTSSASRPATYAGTRSPCKATPTPAVDPSGSSEPNPPPTCPTPRSANTSPASSRARHQAGQPTQAQPPAPVHRRNRPRQRRNLPGPHRGRRRRHTTSRPASWAASAASPGPHRARRPGRLPPPHAHPCRFPVPGWFRERINRSPPIQTAPVDAALSRWGRRTVEVPRAPHTPAALPGRPRRETSESGLPQWSARRQVGIMSAAVEQLHANASRRRPR